MLYKTGTSRSTERGRTVKALDTIAAADVPSRLPYVLFAVAALASFALSVTLWFTGSQEQGIFVGLWVPSILALGAFATGATRAR